MLTATIFLHAIAAFAQNTELEVVNLKSEYEHENEFPEVRCKRNPKVAEKINIFLQVKELGIIPNGYKKDPFENVTYDPAKPHIYTTGFLSWEKNEALHNILSLILEKEVIQPFTTTHNFDARTGNSFVLKDILSESGTKEITKILHNHIRNNIDDFLAKLKKLLSETISEGDKEDDVVDRIKEQIDLYQNCYYYENEPWLEYVTCLFEEKGLTIITEGCANSYRQAIDDLGGFSVSFSYEEIEKYLSPYGKSLLSKGKGDVIPNPNPKGKIFKGKIDSKYPITAIISSVDREWNEIHMDYWYDKEKIQISWNGEYKNNHLTLTEKDEDGNLVANIDAEWVNSKIIGTWTKAGTQKALTLELEEY